jgi:DedD protein
VRIVSGSGAGHAAARTALSGRVYNRIVEASVKERLTGALIFVAAVIVIVPEMFSGPAPESPSAAAATAATAEAGPPLRTFSMTLSDPGEPLTAPTAVAPPAPQPAQQVEAQTVPQPAEAEPLPVAAAPLTTATPVTTAATNPPAPKAAASAAGGNWWLRVGIFGVRGNAEGLAKRLRAAGFDVDLDKQVINGKDMYRVRAGPVRDRSEALALQARLKASGNESLLLAP